MSTSHPETGRYGSNPAPYWEDRTMTSDARKYGTTNPVLIEARISHDPYDEFAWVQEWRFAIAQWLTDASYEVADFRGSDDIRDTYAYEMITAARPTVSDLRYALNILDRYREWLRIAERDY